MGFTGFPFFAGGGGSGYKTVTEVAQRNVATPAYGFLYAEHGKNLPNAQMDFIREKDNPIIKELPNLAVPVAMPDTYSFTSQTGSGQFRLFRGGTGVFFDRDCADFNANTTFGFDLGAGAVATAVRLFMTKKVQILRKNGSKTIIIWRKETFRTLITAIPGISTCISRKPVRSIRKIAIWLRN
jgi:hypothetical protein